MEERKGGTPIVSVEQETAEVGDGGLGQFIAEKVDTLRNTPVDRSEFIQLALTMAAAAGLKAREVLSHRKPEPRLSPADVAIAGSLFEWSNSGDPQDRERRGKIALAITTLTLAVGGSLAYLWSRRKPLGQKLEDDREFRSLPPDWQKELKRRAGLEDDKDYNSYKFGTDKSINPFNITDPVVRKYAGLFGAGWFLDPSRKTDIEGWLLLEKELTDEDIRALRAQPDKAAEVVKDALAKRVDEETKQIAKDGTYERRVTPEVIEFYQQVATKEGREKLLAERTEK